MPIPQQASSLRNDSIISPVCRKCKIFDSIDGKTVCEACAIAPFVEPVAIREHKWNLKVNIRVVGYQCLNCDIKYGPNGLPFDLPECKPIIHKAAPTPFIPSLPKNHGIHAPKYIKPAEKIYPSNYVKKAKPPVKPYNILDYLDFFKEI